MQCYDPYFTTFKLGNYTSDRSSYFAPRLQFLITFAQ